MITDTQMVEAAKIIKERCRDYGLHCEGCPFELPNYCFLNNVPTQWEIPEVSSDGIDRLGKVEDDSHADD